MKTKERLPLRSICFLLLLTAAVFRLLSLFSNGSGQAAALFLGLGVIAEEAVTETPASETITQEYPLLEYRSAPGLLRFTAEDAALVPIDNRSGTEPDIAELMTRPISFTLSVDGPVVLVVHTHATEAYADIADYHTDDTQRNVVRVGEELTERLNALGIPALHDTTLYDAGGYYDAYERAAEGIADALAQYPSIQMVIDLHRDAVTDSDGTQLALTTELGGESAARLLLVMGTDAAGLTHPNWQENLSFAMQLQALCEQASPGCFREMSLRSARYNEHLTPHSILLEVGAAGNTLEQALRSIDFFAEELAILLTSSAHDSGQ